MNNKIRFEDNKNKLINFIKMWILRNKYKKELISLKNK